MSVSSWDDFPVHQTSEFIRFPATSDRNFYDRYYFNMHGSSDELFAIFGIGQYPNLGVQDAYIAVRKGDDHHIVRASRPITDRMDLTTGPFRVEVIEPLQKLRFIVDDTEHSVAMDVTWESSIPAHAEPNQYIRSEGKIVFDTQRFAQLGTWEGTITVGGETHEVTRDRWGGSRDRSWGVRPVGEREPDGIRAGTNVMAGMWNYMPMMFDDHAIVHMNHETPEGERKLYEAVRVWSDPSKPTEDLGWAEHHHEFISGTRVLSGSTIELPDAGITLRCEPLLVNFVSVGTGYGMDEDWRHGLYHGPDLVVQGFVKPVAEVQQLGQYGVTDHVGRFTYTDDRGEHVGHGLYEHGFFGPFPKYGLLEAGDVAS